MEISRSLIERAWAGMLAGMSGPRAC